MVKSIKELFDDMIELGTVDQQALKLNTPWRTHEFGFFDLNRNAIFIVEEI